MAKLKMCTPEELGVDSKGIVGFIDEIEKKKIELHGFVLLRHGSIAAKAFWKPFDNERPHVLQSLQKIITSVGIGIAVSEGLLALDEPIINYFPEKNKSKIPESTYKITLKHMLTGSTGHTESRFVFENSDDFLQGNSQLRFGDRADGDFVQSFLEWPVQCEPGSEFCYNVAASHFLMLLIEKVTGMSYIDFLSSRVFDPVGIERPVWDEESRGKNRVWLLKMRTEDMAKFGQLLLQRGKWKGKQLVPEEWIADATVKHVETEKAMGSLGIEYHFGYGYQFWPCRFNAYRGDGAFGQYCIVMPEQDAVMAINASESYSQAILDAVWEHILPAMKDRAVVNTDTQELENRIALLDLWKYRNELSYEDKRLNKRYIIDNNVFGIYEIDICFENGHCGLVWSGSEGSHSVIAEVGEWNYANTLANEPAAARAGWIYDNTFVVETLRTTSTFRNRLEITIIGDRIDIEYCQNKQKCVRMKGREMR